MNLFERLYEDGKGEFYEDLEKVTLRDFFRLMQQHFFELIIYNIIFVILSLPVITLGASLKALTQVTMDLTRGKSTDCKKMLKYFVTEIKTSFLEGIILVAILTLSLFCFTMDVLMIKGFGLFLMGYSLLIGIYYYNGKAMIEASALSQFKNAFIFALTAIKENLFIIVFVVLPSYFVVSTIQIGAVFLILVHFSYGSLIGSLLSYNCIKKSQDFLA